MAAYQCNGARLGWLLIPEERPLGLREIPSSPGWRWSVRRSGRAEGASHPWLTAGKPGGKLTPEAPIDIEVAIQREDLGNIQPL
jgi:hypothetical protein